MMNKIITISREFGSGGHEIGRKLADKFGVPFYDRSLAEVAAKNIGMDVSMLEGFDEKAASSVVYALMFNAAFATSVGDAMNGIAQDRLFNEQARLIQEYAQQGPCVIVGRCSDYILREYTDCVNFFICAPLESRIKRTMDKTHSDRAEAISLIKKTDKARVSYYQHYTSNTWGTPVDFDFCINTGKISTDEAVELIANIVENK